MYPVACSLFILYNKRKIKATIKLLMKSICCESELSFVILNIAEEYHFVVSKMLQN